jgi:hypothetical protein
VEGRTPKLGVVVAIEEAFTHCPKALIRSDLWNPDRHVERSELPSSGAILQSVSDDGSMWRPTTGSGRRATRVAKACTDPSVPVG